MMTDPMQRQWIGDEQSLSTGVPALKAALARVGQPVFVVGDPRAPAVAQTGTLVWGDPINHVQSGAPLLGFAPPLLPRALGDAGFKDELGLRYAYVVGAMANGITSVEMVQAAGEAGMLGFFGTGGLSLEQVHTAIERLRPYRGAFPYGFNLIHSPHDPQLESAVVDLFLSKEIRLVEASAYLGLTLPLVYYRVAGIHQTPDGTIVCPNRVVAKVSRVEVAGKFFAPPPPKLLTELVRQGKISEHEARLAGHIPLAQEMTAEADSGGHTDNRPALTLLPTFLALRDAAMDQHRFSESLRVGLGGGIATPDAVAAAFAMGAAYVLTGSINQACVEADTSDAVREMLSQTQQADVIMAPAADMFEMGVKVQVLKRGTMFAMRAAKLYELYRTHDHYEQIPEATRMTIEKDLLRATFDQAWASTRHFFEQRDPSQIVHAESNPKHKMALVFRSYLGQSSLWAKTGEPSRRMDYQIWCGPAMGAFNAWSKDTFLEIGANRCVATVGLNLLYGAAGLLRCGWLRHQGVPVPAAAAVFRPLPVDRIEALLDG
ncbi:MAG: PfaD family polyunsaturated fatty acid/polyketide biosynthesis protein [Desulfatitalea sp.]|nr:PfaD family polyunsaturated fatty acid/polyketide biosynthesis protein [Desulfatitalea sp.]